MGSVITIAGEKLFAAKAQANQQLDIDTFIFANVPGQDPTAPIDREEPLPPQAQIVHQQVVQQVGRINENVVVYSTVLDSVTGPFEFNWVGLYSSVNQTLVAINHVPTVAKTVTGPGVAGNTLNRNFGIEYSGIADLTGITVAPETWQLDFTARLSGMDELTRQLAADMNGKDWFIGDGFKVVPRATANSFSVTPGVGYVSGLRIELEQEHIINVQTYPQFVYVDAWFAGDANSMWKPQVAFTVSDTEMDDYIDVQGIKHYVYKLAVINAADAVDDLRTDKKTPDKDWVAKNHVKNELSTISIVTKNLDQVRTIKTNGYSSESDGGSWEFTFTGNIVGERAGRIDYLASEFLIYDVSGREYSAIGKPSLKKIGCKDETDISEVLEALGSRTLKTYIDIDGGSYQISKVCEFLGDIRFDVTEDTRVLATEPMKAGIVFSGEAEITGSIFELDMNKKDTGCGICCRNYLPKFSNVNVFNTNGPTIIRSETLPEIVDGKMKLGDLGDIKNDFGYLNHHNYDNASLGPHIYGSRDPAANAGSLWRFIGEFEFVGMRSTKTCGSSGNLYFASNLRKVTRDGGTFEGSETTGPNCYTCDTVHEKGGIFVEINRGPTVGKNCRNYKITNWIAIGCSYAGASVDLRDDGVPPETEEYPLGYGVVSGGVTRECGYMLYVNGKATSITNNTSYDHKDKVSGAIRINGGGKVWLNGNSCWGCGDNPWVTAGNGTTLQLGVNNHDSKSNIPVKTADGNGSLIQDRLIQVVDARTKATYENISERDTYYQNNLNKLTNGMVIKVADVFYIWNGDTEPTSYDSNLFEQQSNYQVSISSDVDIVRIDSEEMPIQLRFPDMDYANIRTRWEVIRRNGQATISFLVKNGDGSFFGGTEMIGAVRYASVMASSFKEYLSSLPQEEV